MYSRFLSSLLLICLLVACGQSNKAGYTLVKPGTLRSTSPVPPPKGPVVLTMTGKIAHPNVGQELDFDLPTLEQFDQISYPTDDTALKRRVIYQGILLKQVLDVAGVAPDATMLRARALDDYQTDIPLTVTQWPVMLATYRDGQRMAVGDKGPIEVVFPYVDFNIDHATYDPKWVWSIRRVEVR